MQAVSVCDDAMLGSAMSDHRVCPLNNHACRCDPSAADEKLHPCVLAKRVAKLIRLMGSNFEGEAISAATGLRRLLQSEELSFNDLATLIENGSGKLEKKYSDDDANIIFERGEEKGRREAARQQELPPEFYHVDGTPNWYRDRSVLSAEPHTTEKRRAITQRMGTRLRLRHAQQNDPLQQTDTKTSPDFGRNFCQIRRPL